MEVITNPAASTAWLEEASALPLAFAQVREDPLLDLEVVDKLSDDVRVMMVASGGCTAALLASSPKVGRLHLVDPNPAQLALTRLKLLLLQQSVPATRLAVLGHAPMHSSERQLRLETAWSELKLSADVLGPPERISAGGPDQSGRYECLFAALRDSMTEYTDELDRLLRLNNPQEQRRLIARSTPLGRQLDHSLDEIFSLPNLVQLFGAEATRNPVEPFSRHFAGRIRDVLEVTPAQENPYLWQMLAGRYPDRNLSPWISQPIPSHAPQMTWTNSVMNDALADETESFDFVHLSNILDWLSPEQTQVTLELAWETLERGGYVLIRQLNSVLNIPHLGPMFDWQESAARDLLSRDRSFFYRAIHLGRKR